MLKIELKSYYILFLFILLYILTDDFFYSLYSLPAVLIFILFNSKLRSERKYQSIYHSCWFSFFFTTFFVLATNKEQIEAGTLSYTYVLKMLLITAIGAFLIIYAKRFKLKK
jgi:hypothetical protein